jgi:hypothetical protein
LFGSIIGFYQSLFNIHFFPELWIFTLIFITYSLVLVHFVYRILYSGGSANLLLFGWTFLLLILLVEKQVIPGILVYPAISVLIVIFKWIWLPNMNSYLQNLWLTRKHHYKDFYNTILFIRKDDISLLKYYPYSPESVIADTLFKPGVVQKNMKWFWIFMQVLIILIFTILSIVLPNQYVLEILFTLMLLITILYFYFK